MDESASAEEVRVKELEVEVKSLKEKILSVEKKLPRNGIKISKIREIGCKI